jgi:hypothetical protein
MKAAVDERDVMRQQSGKAGGAASALDTQAVLRKERADRERRLEALAITVLTALGERDALVRDTEQRAGQALRTMTDDEGFVGMGSARLVRQRPHCATALTRAVVTDASDAR